MRILSIETSCDETAIALIEVKGELPTPTFEVLSHVLNSQVSIHAEYGGVYPMLAKREHIKNLPIILEKVLEESKFLNREQEIDSICVTVGPGLEPALWTGIEFAKTLGEKWQKPVYGVNHLAGHLWSSWVETTDGRIFNTHEIEFPAISLIVSGGHTELLLVKGFANYEIIGRTRDDAVGEAFDKAGRLLGLAYPAGPKISALAKKDREMNLEPKFSFPSPMLSSKDLDFSYSGLKTAVLYKIREISNLDDATRASLARSFEEAAISPLIKKTFDAIEKTGAQSILLGGGVSANTYLRQKLSDSGRDNGLPVFLPPESLTTDNAIMIGIAGFISLKTSSAPLTLEAKGNLILQSQ